MAESKTFALNFGEAIAFVAPGFLAFKAVSYFSGTAQSWLAAAATGDLTVGTFLFVLLALLGTPWGPPLGRGGKRRGGKKTSYAPCPTER